MMSPRDKMHIIELSVMRENIYIQFERIFQSVIMFKNQNERQEQYNQIICVPVTMIYKKWSPRDNIIFGLILHPKHIFQTTNHYRYDKQGNTCGSQ